MSSVAPSAWLIRPRPNPAAALRLFCLAHAGGGANVFRHWPNGLPAAIEVCAVQLPGRETRFNETAFTHFQPLIEAMANAVAVAIDRPYALFGHSLGSLLAFELVRQLRRMGLPEPVCLIVSGHAAPHLPRRMRAIHNLPHDEFLAELRARRGTPAIILDHAELMKLIAPMLRADFAVYESYRFQQEPVLHCDLTALGGEQDDTVTPEGLAAWQAFTSGRFQSFMLPGDHFFPVNQQPLLLECLRKILGRQLGDEDSPWARTVELPALAADELQVFRIVLERSPEEVVQLATLLDAAERERAGRFRFPKDRDQFIVARAMLRRLLAGATGQAPERIQFAYASAGKPFLRDQWLQFNLAHSGKMALVALGGRRAVGVDVEHLRRTVEIASIVDRYFNPQEQAVLKTEPDDRRFRAFFRAWTRKEAYMKATGQGLYMPLESFAVLPAPGTACLRLQTVSPPEEAARWALRDLEVGPEYVGAAAVAGHGWRLTCWDEPERL